MKAGEGLNPGSSGSAVKWLLINNVNKDLTQLNLVKNHRERCKCNLA